MVRPEVGDVAPRVEALSQSGERFSLERLLGRKVILYFYPRDNTPACTLEARSLRDGRDELRALGFEIVGVSPDGVRSHCEFDRKHGLGFTLLADPDKTIARAYGVWGEKKFMGRTVTGIIRTTFIIDERGRIERVIDKVDTKNHWRQIADLYK